MRVIIFPCIAAMLLVACGDSARPGFLQRDTASAVEVATPGPDTPRPQSRPAEGSAATAMRPSSARTADAFDTTTAAERAAAVQAPPSAGAALGETVASLGSPAEPGFWLRTGLVTAVTPGRVTSSGGASVAVELRPSGAAAGSGSQLSLAALRALNLSLTDLHRLQVTSQ